MSYMSHMRRTTEDEESNELANQLLLRKQTFELLRKLRISLHAVQCDLPAALGEVFLKRGVVNLVVSYRDKADAAHFVFGFFAPRHVDRRV